MTSMPSVHRVSSPGRAERLAPLVLAAALVVAVPVILYTNRAQWFYLDEWDFLIERSMAPSDLLRPHNDHWTSLPIVAYRALYEFVGLHHYWPYQLLTVLPHVASAALLWLVMRRASVHVWVATAAAILFAYFGSGRENLAWGFQVTLTGSLVLGLAAVLLVDHDGPWRRRDAAALVLAVAGLACSGLGVMMAVAVGVTAGLRRGPMIGAQIGMLLGSVQVAWQLGYGAESNASFSPGTTVDFFRAHTVAVVEAFAGGIVGLAVVGVAAVGVVLLVRRNGWGTMRHRAAASIGLAVAGAAFLTSTAILRGSLSTEAMGRYVYVLVGLALPVLALGLSTVVDRWPRTLPVVLAALLVATAFNVDRLEPANPSGLGSPGTVLAIAAVDPPPGWPEGYMPPPDEVYLRLDWLHRARAEGRVPDPPDPARLGQARLRVSLLPLYSWSGRDCVAVEATETQRLREGQILRVKAPSVTLRRHDDVASDAAFLTYGSDAILGGVFAPGDDGAEVRLLAVTDIAVKVFPTRTGPLMEVCDRA